MTDNFAARWWRSFVLDPIRKAEAEARANPGGGGKTVVVLVVVALMLTLQHYLLQGGPLRKTYLLLQDIGLARVASWFDAPLEWALFDDRKSLGVTDRPRSRN